MPQPTSVLVIGCGISGLASALRLQAAGYHVTIYTREPPSQTTSNVAAALWYPYRCAPQEKVLAWSKVTFDELMRQHAAGVPGVTPTTFIELFDTDAPDPWWAAAVGGVTRQDREALPPGYVVGFSATVPVVETPRYLPYLVQRFETGGGVIVERQVSSLDEVGADYPLIINCTGLGARQLVNDPEVFPIRGQVVRVSNPGIRRALTDDEGPRRISYTIPRQTDVILGGTALPNVWDTTPETATTERVLRNCRELEPALAAAQVLETRVGLRPGRSAVRLEVERMRTAVVIHNYGHGGAGFTLAWGCADEVCRLAHLVLGQWA
ncbi:FAD-dependent oxidoreductase [Chloracidobacterium validum]|uniref:D-amino-acid oxidase n=1 Tax=Chloracidobacterium validum TaxID=2821543 RepID=A0ABX8B9I8_9BACT|nr:FAD-dependent oxidoreductase [Chloracidobacterium validum]QUW02308.1 FAD-dependent oxidoreductase [Chloracidobacterium validum]